MTTQAAEIPTQSDESLAATEYYIQRSGKTHGPVTLEELRNYLAYGSMSPTDLVCRAGSQHWLQAHALAELLPAEPEADLRERLPPWLQWLSPLVAFFAKSQPTDTTSALTPRRRIVRYRDYDKVPLAHRASSIASMMFWGFILFPPWLWKASAIVFSQRIYRSKADAAGYLKTWPRWVEMLCALLIAINALLWIIALYWLLHTAYPIAREVLSDFAKAVQTLWSNLGTRPKA
jgi:hypothetical protein